MELEYDRKEGRRNIIIAAASVTALAASAGALYWFLQPEVPEVRFIEPSFGAYRMVIQGTGELEPNKVITLSNQQAGLLDSVMNRDGDMLKLGEKVIQLKNPELELKVTELKADLASMQEDLALAEVSQQVEILDLADTLARQERELALAQDELKRNQTLAENGNASYLSVMRSQAAFDAAQQALNSTETRKGLTEQEQAIRNRIAQNKMVQLRAEIGRTETQLEQLTVSSDMPGRLRFTQDWQEGAYVGQYSKIAQVVVGNEMVAQASIAISRQPYLQQGMTCNFDVQGKAFEGEVAPLESVNSEGFYEQKFLLYQQSEDWTEGLPANYVCVYESEAPAYQVTLDDSIPRVWRIWRVRDGELSSVRLDVIHLTGDQYRIDGDVQEGDKLILEDELAEKFTLEGELYERVN